MKTTPMFDRKSSNPFLLEKGYIDLLSFPTLNLYCTFAANLKQELIQKGIEENKKFIENKLEETSTSIDHTATESNLLEEPPPNNI